MNAADLRLFHSLFNFSTISVSAGKHTLDSSGIWFKIDLRNGFAVSVVRFEGLAISSIGYSDGLYEAALLKDGSVVTAPWNWRNVTGNLDEIGVLDFVKEASSLQFQPSTPVEG